MVKNFEDWKAVVQAEYKKLSDMESYLNNSGKNRKFVYGSILNMACYCSSAQELLNWISDPMQLEDDDKRAVTDPNALHPLNALKKLAEKERQGVRTMYVTFKIDARFIAKVEAVSVEDALAKANVKWQDANFGVAEDIDGEAIIIEDENGEYLWEKS